MEINVQYTDFDQKNYCLNLIFYNINSNMKGIDSPFKVSDLFSPLG